MHLNLFKSLNLLKILLIIISNLRAYSQQAVFKINSPSDAKEVATIIGYDYFKTDTIGYIQLDEKGYGQLSHNYKGFALVYIGNDKQYPIILSKLNFLNITTDNNFPKFKDDYENNFLYNQLVTKDKLSRKIMVVNDALQFFTKSDSLRKFLYEEKHKLEIEEKKLKKILTDSSFYFSAKLLMAKNLIESTYEVKTLADINNLKITIMDFVKKNIEILKNSDMLQKLVLQYILINEHPIASQQSDLKTQVLRDLTLWVKQIGRIVGNKAIINFFIKYYNERNLFVISTKLSEYFYKEATCKCDFDLKHYDKNISITNLNVNVSNQKGIVIPFKDIISEYKILHFYDDNCPATISQNITLSNYIASKNIQIPVITIIKENPEEFSVNLLSQIKKGPFYYIQDNNVFKLFNVKNIPFFVVLNKDNKVIRRFNTIVKLNNYLEHLTK